MTKKERLKRVILARRLLAHGAPLTIDQDEQDFGLRTRQIGGEIDSSAFDLIGGRPGYMVNMSITITQSGFAIAGILLGLPWTDHGLSLIEDPLVSAARYDCYWFPGEATLAFEREAVINHFVNVRRLLRRGETMEGLLLWVGSEPIPDAFVHGTCIPASVIVVDQYDNWYPSEVTLWANRSHQGTQDRHKRKARPPLFSQRDPSPERSHSRADTREVEIVNKKHDRLACGAASR